MSCNAYDEQAVVLAWLESGGRKLEDIEDIVEEPFTTKVRHTYSVDCGIQSMQIISFLSSIRNFRKVGV